MNSKTPLFFAAFTANKTITNSPILSVRSNRVRQSTQLSARNTKSYGLGRPRRQIVTASLLAIATASPLTAEVPKQARAAIDRTIGSPGTYIPEEGVYKIVLPQPDATVVRDYQTLSPNFGLNLWVSVASAVHHEAFLMGQLLLLEDEVNPVMAAVLSTGLEINGLADSSTFDGPRLKMLDVTAPSVSQASSVLMSCTCFAGTQVYSA
jgi:hypothetical protein